MIITDSQLRKIIQEEIALVQERYGFGDKVMSALGLQKDFNYEAPEMPFGGRTRDGQDFIVIQIPTVSGTRDNPAVALGRRDEGGYLVLLDNGEEVELSAEDMMTGAEMAEAFPGSVHGRAANNDATPFVSRGYGGKLKSQFEKAGVL